MFSYLAVVVVLVLSSFFLTKTSKPYPLSYPGKVSLRAHSVPALVLPHLVRSSFASPYQYRQVEIALLQKQEKACRCRLRGLLAQAPNARFLAWLGKARCNEESKRKARQAGKGTKHTLDFDLSRQHMIRIAFAAMPE